MQILVLGAKRPDGVHIIMDGARKGYLRSNQLDCLGKLFLYQCWTPPPSPLVAFVPFLLIIAHSLTHEAHSEGKMTLPW